MARETVLRKRSRDGRKVCTTYGISDPSCKFTFDTCDNIETTIKDSKGLTVAILSLNAPTATISKKGNYNVCIEGEGIGTLYTECGQGGGGECCDELREKISQLEQRINNIINGTVETGCCEELRTELELLKERVRRLEEGGGGGGGSDCCDELREEINNIKTRLTTVENNIENLTTRLDNQNITGGTGISVTKQGDSYIINNTGGGGLPADFAINQGDNVQVVKQGNQYTISATDTVPDVNKQYVDDAIAGIPTTTLVEGANVTITDSGTGGSHVYTISASGGGEGGLPQDFSITGGDNVTVQKSGNVYTVSATDTKPDVTKQYVDDAIAGIEDNDTVTTLTAGSGVTITDTGTGGNHNYKIDVDGGMDFADDYMVISKSPNIIITARGDEESTPNIFTYDASVAGATAENNQLIEFETGKDKIRIRKTILPEGPLTAWATSGAGIYYDASTGIISYNDGTTTKTLVKVDDGSTVVPSDVIIMNSVAPPVTYTITFDANGGTVTPASATTGADGKLASLPTPTHATDTFTGWFTATTGGTQVTTDTVFTSNQTIHAQWQAVTNDLPVFATVSSLTSMDQITIDYTDTEHILNMPAQTEDNPIIIEVPTENNFVLTMWNPLINQWVTVPNKWDVSSTTRTIDGNSVAYTRYTENCECDSGAVEIRLTWTV